MTSRWLATLLVVALPAAATGQTEPTTSLPTTRDELERRQATIAKAEPEELFSINGGLLGTMQWIARNGPATGSVFGSGSGEWPSGVGPCGRKCLSKNSSIMSHSSSVYSCPRPPKRVCW